MGKVPVISVRDVHIKQADQEIVKGVSFDIWEGEQVVLTGPSGAGKSTLLHAIAGIVRPSEGRILVNGTDIQAIQRQSYCERFIRETFGICPQRPRLDGNSNIETNIRNQFDAVWEGRGRLSRRRAAELAVALGIAGLLQHSADKVSGGELQRAAIMRLLAIAPPVRLWDEPTAALDGPLTDHVFSVMREVSNKDNATSLAVTHDRESALAHFATREIIMADGLLLSPNEYVLSEGM